VRPSYNLVAGRSTERLAALSDGIFGAGMTLLVLGLRMPLAEAIHGEHEVRHALLASFLTLGIFWVGLQTQLNRSIKAGPFRRKRAVLALLGISYAPAWHRSATFAPLPSAALP